VFGLLLTALSAEFILDWRKSNGGAAIMFRSLWTSGLLFLALLLAKRCVDSLVGSYCLGPWPDCAELLALATKHSGLLLALIAGTYLAYYTRFASQWTYLAGVYNQIKGAEVANEAAEVAGKEPNKQALADWKSGFIVDAWSLHLIAKPIFVNAVRTWGVETLVYKQVKDWPRIKRFVDDLQPAA
jgi:hypothetical protein